MADAETAVPLKSDGQKILDRLLATRNRLNEVKVKLDKVAGDIGAPSRKTNQLSATAPMNQFFEGLSWLADEFDRLAEEIDSGVDNIAEMF